MARSNHAAGRALPSRSRTPSADLPGVRGPCPQGLGGPRRAQLHQGPARRHAVVPLVVPHGRLRQLRHDGQRRAEADLRHVPHRLRARARCASSRCANFPVIRDLVVDIGDFMRKLTTVKPWIVRKEEKPLSEGEYLQTPRQLDEYKQFSMCINCMLCYAACPIYGLDPKFIGPAAIALAQRYNLDSRDEGAQERLRGALAARGHLGLHVRRRVHQGLPEARRSGRRHPALQARSRARLAQVVRDAVGAR